MTRVAGRHDIRTAVDDLLQRPPATPPELFLRLIQFEHYDAYAELVRRLVDTDLDRERQLIVIQWLVEIGADDTSGVLIEAVTDRTRPIEKRALALLVFTATRKDEAPLSLPIDELQEMFNVAADYLSKAEKKIQGPARIGRGAAVKRACRTKVTLRHTRPPVWRRFEVTDDITFARLHDVLQRVMGWTDSHLHMFHVAGRDIGVSDPEWEDVENEKRIRLRDIVDGLKRFQYDYDFGDDWQHDVVIEKTFAPERGVRYPRCTAGKRACPPEDCGGVRGYAELIETLANPESEEYEEMREWSADWEPERFDVDAVNRNLRTR